MPVIKMNIKVKKIAYHRNGISGEPFHAVVFKDRRFTGLAVVFDESKHVAVFDLELLGKEIFEFGANSYRADLYEPELREAIEAWEESR